MSPSPHVPPFAFDPGSAPHSTRCEEQKEKLGSSAQPYGTPHAKSSQGETVVRGDEPPAAERFLVLKAALPAFSPETISC